MSGIKPSGAHKEKRLSAAFVRNLKEPGFYADGNGLYLKVDTSGAKRWVQRVVIHGKRRDIGLGSASLVTLAEAREKALEQRKLARAGKDPIALKRRSTGILTFEEAAERLHEIKLPTWRNDKHAKQFITTLRSEAFPTLGKKRIDTITAPDILSVLTPIWHKKPETAKRVRQRISSVLKYAIAQEWRTDNPAGPALSMALPKHDRLLVKHRKALHYDAVSDALTKVRSSAASTATKLAFEFLVLTNTRSGETLNATWDEVSMERAEWVIPASRMKAGKEHRVPLSRRALAVLDDAKSLRLPASNLIFPGTKKDRPLSNMTLSKLVKELGIAAVPHGFRSSFRDWAGEQTNHPHEVIEFAMAHTIKNKAEAAYARSDLFEKRRALMNDWADYVSEKKRH